MTNSVRSVRGTATLISIIVGIFITVVIGWFAIILPYLLKMERDQFLAYFHDLIIKGLSVTYPEPQGMFDTVFNLTRAALSPPGLSISHRANVKHFSYIRPKELIFFFRSNSQIFNQSINFSANSEAPTDVRFHLTSNLNCLKRILCQSEEFLCDFVEPRDWRLSSFDRNLTVALFTSQNFCHGSDNEPEFVTSGYPIIFLMRYEGIVENFLKSLGSDASHTNAGAFIVHPKISFLTRSGRQELTVNLLLTFFTESLPSLNGVGEATEATHCLNPWFYTYANISSRFILLLKTFFNVEAFRFMGYFQTDDTPIDILPVEIKPGSSPFSLLVKNRELIVEGIAPIEAPSLQVSRDFSNSVRLSQCYLLLDSLPAAFFPSEHLNTFLGAPLVESSAINRGADFLTPFFGPTIHLSDSNSSYGPSDKCAPSSEVCLRLAQSEEGVWNLRQELNPEVSANEPLDLAFLPWSVFTNDSIFSLIIRPQVMPRGDFSPQATDQEINLFQIDFLSYATTHQACEPGTCFYFDGLSNTIPVKLGEFAVNCPGSEDVMHALNQLLSDSYQGEVDDFCTDTLNWFKSLEKNFNQITLDLFKRLIVLSP